ncbi:hypothetical protein ACKQTC_07110 [Peptococcus simiae]|uniref:TrbL/VirB6 plasmid conjugal transfer protein n=1 Tax=Peptococcus simiae TaxID=1643805 RepID=A0ABW9GZY5_9FIRM
MFQAIAIGLTLAIAIWQLFKFFGGQLTEVRDTPIRILIRTAIAGWLIFFGGYFIDLIVNIAQIPYEAFSDVKALESVTSPFEFDGFDLVQVLFGTSIALGESGAILAYLFLVFLVGWNLLKLMLEIVERYLMVAVLAFTAPLFYSTFSSQSTSGIFKKFVGMFFGQCAILSVSAWMLKVIISGLAGLTADAEGMIFHVIFILAMCKIAQRVDTYMQSLGIGVALTGENILDDVIAGSRMLRSMGGNRGGGDRKEALGANTAGSLSRFGGVFGAASNATQRMFQRSAQGEGFLGTFSPKQVGKDALEGAGPVGRAALGQLENRKAGISDNNPLAGKFDVTDAYNKKAAETEENKANTANADNTAQAPDPNSEIKYQDPSQARDADGIAASAARLFDEEDNPAEGAEKLFEAEKKETPQVSANAGIVKDDKGQTGLNDEAKKYGLSWDNNHANKQEGERTNQIEGDSHNVGAFMAARVAAGENPEDLQAALTETATNGSPLAAEKALMQPDYNLKGNDQVMSAMVSNSFDTQEIVGDDGDGTISNVTATTGEVEGARQVTFDYTDTDGNTSSYEIVNSEAIYKDENGHSVTKEIYQEPGVLKQIRSRGTGGNYYVRKVDVGQSQMGVSTSGGTRTVQAPRPVQVSKPTINQSNMPKPKGFRQPINKKSNTNSLGKPNNGQPGKKN